MDPVSGHYSGISAEAKVTNPDPDQVNIHLESGVVGTGYHNVLLNVHLYTPKMYCIINSANLI